MLPTESELRLLKDLQLAINKSTKTIDAEKVKDQPKLLALGNRQGELRNLLDETIKKASQGKQQLGPEPDPKDQLPEEAGKEQVEQIRSRATQKVGEAVVEAVTGKQ